MSEDRTQNRPKRRQPAEGTGARLTPARRKLLLRIGLVALVIAVLTIVPGYVATQPKFLKRYSSLEGEYATWSRSVHAKIPCQQCHVAPTLPAQAAYDVRMLGEFYLSLVMTSRQPTLFSSPTNAACAHCHIDLRTVSPKGDVKIPHRAHVNVLKLRCVKCHAYLVHKKNPEGTNRPRMADCLRCHNGRTAKNACSACHTNKGFPISHRAADWVIVHPDRQNQIDCKKCHKWAADWCAKCHAKRPRAHGVDWRKAHALKVKTRRNCEACHQAPFCIRCHGEVPSLNFNPALKLVR